jgi:hypothetical protein
MTDRHLFLRRLTDMSNSYRLLRTVYYTDTTTLHQQIQTLTSLIQHAKDAKDRDMRIALVTDIYHYLCRYPVLLSIDSGFRDILNTRLMVFREQIKDAPHRLRETFDRVMWRYLALYD